MKGRVRTVGESENYPQEDADVPLATGEAANTANYIIKLGFGTPRQSFYTAVDTGSDITWIPCTHCSDCSGQVFEPSKSPTFQYMGCASEACQTLGSTPSCGNYNCSFTQTYGDGSQLDEVLSSDTLAVGSQSLQKFIFGCGRARSGLIRSTPGLVGFASALLLSRAVFNWGKAPFPRQDYSLRPCCPTLRLPSFYYVGLNGISVGDELVSVQQSMGEGTIIDSGTVISRLVEPAYNAMRDSFRRQLSNLSLASDPYSIFDTCYNISSGDVDVPQITLHFQNSVDLVLPADNFLIPVNDKGSVACLPFALPPGNSTVSVISIIGNYQQQNFRVVYDVPGSRLGVVSESCDN